MLDLLSDKIDFKKSKRRKILTFKKHDWLFEFATPGFLFIPLISTFYRLLFLTPNTESVTDMTIFYLVVGLITILGIFILFKNLTSFKLYTIYTGKSNEKNRERVREISKELGIKKMYDNKHMYRGIYENTFKFNQVVTIIYDNEVILINTRNAIVSSADKLGRITFSSKHSKKLCLAIFNGFKKFDETDNIC
ncbi:MAG: hypothetical protein CVV25_09110 [Ignavibacteriae bacterium HGW-Ignavibacteriae-4]|jgi:hypothetical protein|nr:MAG: hypothetical protein CVV25_09110 [Ignavibacteriae bacterium HGW-Ignavibacteriae-4]